MNYRTLGHTGTKVSPLCLGAMMFGDWGNKDHDDSIRIIHRALDAGINFIDTADVYSRGESEEIVGKALAGGRREHVVLATKLHGKMGDDPNEFGNSRRWIIREVENSLRRLGTDWIDLYQIHRPEVDTDIDETLGALTDLVRSGKVRYIGSSTFPASQIVEAQWVAERRSRERFVCEQPPYSILVREVENDVLPTCQRHHMGVIPWSPLAGGWLSGRYRKGAEVPQSHRAAMTPGRYDMSLPGNQRKLEAAENLARLAEEAGMTLIEMALAFVLRHPAVTAAIIGPRTMEQLESQLTAADVTLSDDAARQDRCDRRTGYQPQRGRRRVGEPGPGPGGPPPVAASSACGSIRAGEELVEARARLAPHLPAQQRSPAQRRSGRAEGLARPGVERERVVVLGDEPVLEAELGPDVIVDPAPGRGEGVIGEPVGGSSVHGRPVLDQRDHQVRGATGQHPPHRPRLAVAQRRRTLDRRNGRPACSKPPWRHRRAPRTPSRSARSGERDHAPDPILALHQLEPVIDIVQADPV